MTLSRNIIFFIVATIPILFAAVQPWIWSFYTVCIFAAFLILLWQNRDKQIWIQSKNFIVFLGLFFAVTLFQSLPLPFSILSFLSPFRHKVLTQSSAIINSSVAWNTLSYSSRSSLAWWTFLLSLLMFFLVFRQTFTSSRYLKLLIYILLGLAALEALYGLIQALVPTLGVLWVDYIKSYLGDARGTYINRVPTLGVLWVDYIKSYLGDARGTYINRNHFAGFIEMIFPLILGYTLALSNWDEKLNIKTLMSTDRPNFQFFLTICLAVMLLALVFSKSRAGITGGVLGFLIFVCLVHSGSKGLPRSYWVIISIIIGMVTFYSFRIGVDPVLERFLMISKDTSRLNLWRDSMVIVKDHPIGTGLATFKQVFSVYNTHDYGSRTIYYAHNDYVQLLVETGWIGFATLVTGFYIF
ncbi:MAG: O-antigen ligase family protein, partial [Deltaproteobacteria bacterium]|nr:O-antigen ligase family protein [Deltaproteobacteria bacterium]